MDEVGEVIPKASVPQKFTETAYHDYGYLRLDMYVTSRILNPIADTLEHRLDRSVATVSYNGTAASMPQTGHVLHQAYSYEEYEYFTCNFIGGTRSYTLLSTDNGFYGAPGGMYSHLYSQAVVEMNDGSELVARVFVPGFPPVDPTV